MKIAKCVLLHPTFPLSNLQQMSYQSFKVNTTNFITTVLINRPEKANSLDMASWKELGQVFDDLSNDKNTRVIILAGEGKHFSSGMDLKTLMGVTQSIDNDCFARKNEALRKVIIDIQNFITSIERCKKPVLAAIDNACIGGAMAIATACDMRYCTRETIFVIKEIEYGFVADIGHLQRMPKFMNPAVVAELAYTGRQVAGIEAERIGLVNKCFDNRESLFQGVNVIASVIAARSPLAIRGTKEMLIYQRDHSVQDSLENMANYNAGMLMSKDLASAMQASFAKSNPVFED